MALILERMFVSNILMHFAVAKIAPNETQAIMFDKEYIPLQI